MSTTPNSTQSAVSAVIEDLMTACEKGNKDMAALIGCSPSGVSRRLSGKTDWSLDELAIIAEALGEPITIFFDRDELDALVQRRRARRFTLIDGGDVDELPTIWYTAAAA